MIRLFLFLSLSFSLFYSSFYVVILLRIFIAREIEMALISRNPFYEILNVPFFLSFRLDLIKKWINKRQ